MSKNDKILSIINNIILNNENDNYDDNDIMTSVELNELKNDMKLIDKDNLETIILLDSFKYFVPDELFEDIEENDWKKIYINHNEELIDILYNIFCE